MKPKFKSINDRLFIPALLTLGLATGGALAQTNFVLQATDGGGFASFDQAVNFKTGNTPAGTAVAPTTGNTYQTGAFRIRTQNNGASYTFQGDSLEIQAGLGWRIKNTGTNTVNNLILADLAVLELSQPGGTNGTGSVGTLAGNISLSGGTAIFMAGNPGDSASHVFTVSSTISGLGGITTGNPSVNLGGALANSIGTVVLTGDNSYSGNTSVPSGTLRVNNTTGSGTGTGTVTVGTSGTLSGTGSLGGATTVNGRLAPGPAVGAGNLTFNGGLTLGSLVANSLRFDLGANTTPGTTYDTITTSTLEVGTLDFADFQFTNTGGLAPGIYTLATSAAAITGSIGTAAGTISGYPATLSISAGNLLLTIDGIADTTAPNWLATYPKVGTITSTGFNALASTNENGTAYFLVLPDGDPEPTAETVKTTGTAISLTASAETSSTVIGLTPSNSYDVYFVAQDLVPNLQASPVKVDVTLEAFQAANFVLTANDAPTTNSFNTGLNWGLGTPVGAAGQAPSAGNTYQTGAFRLRTPQAFSNLFTFAGDSLEVQAGGSIRQKTVGTVTIGNLILADTALLELSQPNGQTGVGLAFGGVAGSISLTSGMATFMAGNPGDGPNHVYTISSDISGLGGLNTTGSGGNVILTGTNTYTGPTEITAGTLSLVGGSMTSPITVSSGATLGFDADSTTVTSTSTVTFSGLTAKVAVTGTPVVKTLMTASGITGTPVLDPLVPGFDLQVTATQLNLVVAGGNPYTTWANTFSPADVTSPIGDNDGDGLTNQQEFAFGLNPTSGSSVNPILVQLNKTARTFTYQRRIGTGLTYKILWSTTLGAGSWSEDVAAGQVATASGDNESVVVTLSGTPPAGDKLFIRVAAEEAP